MSNEKEAALEKLTLISPDASKDVLYCKYFNTGVILYRMGKKIESSEYFRKALEVDSTRLEAKINLELSLNRNEAASNDTKANMIPSGEDNYNESDNLEKTVFERIKENDKKQWKNSEITETSDLSSDY